ncbi:MAG: hypothetical protein IIA10_10265, partial [Proteobacteria bacterium]|nr:hypothetical protein [Pseudomonadota bacterium]
RSVIRPSPADGRPIYDRPSTYDVILTNTGQGSSDTFSISADKIWDTRAGIFDFSLAYTLMDAEDVNPSQSSTVSSNFGRPATFDRNNRQLSRSDFEIEDRISGTFGWQKNLFGDNITRISGFFEYRTGHPFSYTMRERPFDEAVWGGHSTFARRDSQLLYVPLLNDPNVIFNNSDGSLVNDPALEADFNAFIAAAGLEGFRGQIMPRNHDTTASRSKVDIRISQEIGLSELPGVGEVKAMLFLDIENFGNLLNDDWGRVEQVFFPFNFTAVGEVSWNDASGDGIFGNAGDQYVYGSFGSGFSGGIDPASFFSLQSVYKIQLGIEIRF